MNLKLVQEAMQNFYLEKKACVKYIGDEYLIVQYSEKVSEIHSLERNDSGVVVIKTIYSGSLDSAKQILDNYESYCENKKHKRCYVSSSDKNEARLEFMLRKIPFDDSVVQSVLDEIETGLVLAEAVDEVILSNKLKAL